MITIPCNQATFFDCDDTLVMWSATPEQLSAKGIEFTCPGSLTLDEDGTLIKYGTWKEKLLPHEKHIEQLKKHKLRGHTIVVWSAGGCEWAQAVVETLGLQKYVDLVISKPMWAYDDKQPNEFIPKPQWMKDE